jgi:hypothetical protein
MLTEAGEIEDEAIAGRMKMRGAKRPAGEPGLRDQ